MFKLNPQIKFIKIKTLITFPFCLGKIYIDICPSSLSVIDEVLSVKVGGLSPTLIFEIFKSFSLL
jgi:hypothetical protein